jgi:hypothetical protein
MSDPVLAPWESFYVIVGSSGAALTGLQFVVMALIADSDRKGGPEVIEAFGTPTVVHFCAVLGVAGVLSAPWDGVGGPSILLALAGLVGLVYAGIITARARRQTDYSPVWEDWLWHSIIPAIAYALVAIGAVGLWVHARNGLFMIAAASMLLLFTGIHNAWDSVAYITVQRFGANQPKSGI